MSEDETTGPEAAENRADASTEPVGPLAPFEPLAPVEATERPGDRGIDGPETRTRMSPAAGAGIAVLSVAVLLAAVLAALLAVTIAFPNAEAPRRLVGEIRSAVGMAPNPISEDDSRRLRAEAGDRAAEIIGDLLTYEWKDVDKDLAEATKDLTGTALAEIEKLAPGISTVAKEKRITSQATVTAKGFQEVTADRVALVVFITQTVDSSDSAAKATQVTAESRAVMVRDADGGWKLAEFTAVGA